MDRIHIARNQRSIGQFSPEEVAERLATGDFLPTDLGWREPMESWQPLSTFTDLPVVDLALIPPALPDEAEAPVAAAAPGPAEPAWERREQLGVLPAIAQTIRQVFSEPAATFRAMKREGGFGIPLGFFLLVFTVTTLVMMTYSLIIIIFYPEAVSESMGGQKIPTSTLIFGQVITMIMTPLMAVAGAFVAAGILHAVFMALGGATQPFEATFRAWCYAMASASVFQLIPLCGGVAMWAAAAVLLIIALREVHKTTGSVAAAGVIFPALLCGGCVLGMHFLAQALVSQGMLVK